MLHHTKLSFRGKLTPRDSDGTKYIVIHHTKTGKASVEDIHRWHLDRTTNCVKWAGFGYHYYVRKDGEIYEGRPLNTQGAHVLGHNSDTIGVCFEGDFYKERMTETQLNASILLLSLLLLSFKGSQLRRHDTLDKKSPCPGKFFPYDELAKRVRKCKKQLQSVFGKEDNFDYRSILNLFPAITEN